MSRWLSSPITPMAVPNEASADMSGKSMAKIDPNTSSSTMAARITPRPVPPKDCLSADSATWPATATCKVGLEAVWAVDTNFLAAGIEMYWACWSKVTVAKAVVPFLLIWPAP